VAVLPPLLRMLFWIGPVAEQALVVNVRGFGLLLVTGCGHPQIERILGVTEQVLDVPVRGMLGGLHLPVHLLGTLLVPQAVLGSPHWLWRPIGERDVEHVLDEIAARVPRLVALSSHDSTPWAYGPSPTGWVTATRHCASGGTADQCRRRPRGGPGQPRSDVRLIGPR
jgi:7,8-dihydropterin-6-yl-methyl-4-(beta-D-ribofuranosyl)aminobenzene 5'-phosphate synthase